MGGGGGRERAMETKTQTGGSAGTARRWWDQSPPEPVTVAVLEGLQGL